MTWQEQRQDMNHKKDTGQGKLKKKVEHKQNTCKWTYAVVLPSIAYSAQKHKWGTHDRASPKAVLMKCQPPAQLHPLWRGPAYAGLLCLSCQGWNRNWSMNMAWEAVVSTLAGCLAWKGSGSLHTQVRISQVRICARDKDHIWSYTFSRFYIQYYLFSPVIHSYLRFFIGRSGCLMQKQRPLTIPTYTDQK